MAKTRTLPRIERLELLASRLRANEPLILRSIAEEFGISLSTINRDIALLRERGIPVEADRGRGGGVRINSTWGVGRVALTYREAIDLLVSLASIEKMQLSMMLGNSKSIRAKLIGSFSKSDQAKIKTLASRIRVGPTSSPQVISTFRPEKTKVTEVIKESFLLMRQMQITYRRDDNTLSKRVIEPHYMILNHPIWYVLAWDHLRNDIRTFRCDRLESVSINNEMFKLRPFDDFEKSMKGNALDTL